MQTILLSFILYFQNFFITYISDIYFEPNIYEYLLILTLLIFIQTFRHKTLFLIIWQSIYFIEFLFISYFNSTIKSYDIKLFFTHIDETFSSIIGLYSTFIFTIVFSAVIFILILILKKTIYISKSFLVLIIIILIFLQPKNQNDLSLNFIQNIFNITLKNQNIIKNNKQLKPLKEITNNLNIILVIGESMRYKNLSLFGYEKNTTLELNKYKTELFYKTIYSGATNTDVSIPLLLNGATQFDQIDLSNNLFTLALNNNFKTSFISTQSNKSLQYIKPYLGNNIQNFNILGTKLDDDLIKYYSTIDIKNGNHFTVLNMTGQHSPYTYYPDKFNLFKGDSIEEKYNNTVLYSDFMLASLIKKIKKQYSPTIFIFTSDHGELIGQNNQYGHNRFNKDIYTVPLIIYTKNINIPKAVLNKIHTHKDIYSLLKYFLGYSNTIDFCSSPYQVNGTMQTGEDGFIFVD